MLPRCLLTAAFALPLCMGCASTPERSADVEYYAPKAYRTGSNIPVKDYGAENIEVRSPDIINPVHRPFGSSRAF